MALPMIPSDMDLDVKMEDVDDGSRSPPQLLQDDKSIQGSGKGKRLRMAPPQARAAAAAAQAQAEAELLAQTGEAETAIDEGTHVSEAHVKLPLDINTRVHCLWKDGNYYQVKIIERRPLPGPEDPRNYEYYVHYKNFNRRMDDWVRLEHMDLKTVIVDVVVEGEGGRKKKHVHDDDEHDEEHADFDPNALREHEEFTKVKNIEKIELGRHEMDTWYFSPFPPEYNGCHKLYFCEYSLHFFKRRSQLLRHLQKCPIRHPPGDEIYRNAGVSMFEVDGRKERMFCQNLCYLAKLFLDHKTLYYDVDLFLFYVLCEVDERGAHIVGYFSKEKNSEEGYNLACILALPAYQRKGYGKFLISFSYELSKLEGKVGTPERPLSDLGVVSYRGYWTRVLLKVLRDHEGSISIKDLSEMTSIKPDDILTTLQHWGLVQYQKGQHVMCAAPGLLDDILAKVGSAGLEVDPSKIVWTPYNAEKDYEKYRN